MMLSLEISVWMDGDAEPRMSGRVGGSYGLRMCISKGRRSERKFTRLLYVLLIGGGFGVGGWGGSGGTLVSATFMCPDLRDGG